MRTLFTVFFHAAVCAVFLYPQTASPAAGIWENATRFVEIKNDGTCRFVLKPYYAFYYDDAASFLCRYTEKDGAGLLEIEHFPGRPYSQYAVKIAEDGLYTDFLLKSGTDTEQETTAEKLSGFWRPAGNTDGIQLGPPRYRENVYGWYFTGTSVFKIRYWPVDVPYSAGTAVIQDGGAEYPVDKYIQIGPVVYTCAAGKTGLVRNAEKTDYKLDGLSLIFDSAPDSPVPFRMPDDASFLSFSAPYLTRSDIESLDDEIAMHNALRRPPRKPLLEPAIPLDFRWDEIERIRNNGKTK